MMERLNYKKRSTLPSIIKLLYLTGLLSTLLTCIFLWYSRTDPPRQGNSNFLVAIPQEVLHLPRVTPILRVGRRRPPEEQDEDFLRPGPPQTSTDHGMSISSLEIDFDDSFNDYISPSGNIVVQSNLSSKDKGTSPTASEVGMFMERKLNLPTSSLMDFEDPGQDIFTSAPKKPTRSSSFGRATTPITLITKGLHNVEFKSKDSMQDRLDLVEHYCSAVSSEGKSYLENVMLLLDQRTNKWIQFSKFVSRKDGDHIFTKRVTLQWCPVFKAASTPWMAVMMKLKNYLSPEMEQLIRSGKVTFVKLAKLFHMNVNKPLPYSVTRTMPSEVIMKTESPVVVMLVVRHPFERLLSAYRDKLERVKGRDYYHFKYGLPIVQRFRSRNKWKSYFSVPLMTLRQSQGSNDDVNSLFPADDLMVDPSSNRFTVFGRRVSNQRRLTPTFDEFVQYLLTLPPAEMDEHWRPMYIDCNACTNSFNLIFKVETMDQDRDYLLSLLGVNATAVSLKAELDKIWRRWTNSVGKDTLPASAWKTRHDYFSQVSQQNLQALYELYKPDFLMFGYSPDKYLDMTG